MRPYPVPLHEVRREMTVANSRFIATLAPAFSVEQAKAFIARLRTEFSDASHNVPAYVVGHGDTVIAHCSDAGEPSGTAGRPALAVLRGSDLGDAAVVVTRYFGGVKLGTGGLVRAYGDAVRLVVEAVPRAEKVRAATLVVEIPYSYLDRLRLLVASQGGEVLDEAFTAQVRLTARFREANVAPFEEAVQRLSNGKIQAEAVEVGEILVPLARPA